MALRTRKPSGAIAYPLLLVEGLENSGKTYASLSLSKSKKVGRTFVLELGERRADEYKAIGDYEIIEHNGTWSDIMEQLTEATKVPMVDGKPNVIIVDSCSALWGLLKDWADSRARRSRRGRETLAKDPDAEVDITMNLWTDAKERWYDMLNLFRSWNGVAILVARGEEKAKVVNGTPVAGQTEWTTEAQKSTRYEVTAVVRMSKPHTATLTDANSLMVDVPAKGIVLPEANPLEHLVFDVLGAGVEFTQSEVVVAQVGTPAAEVKQELIDKLKASAGSEEAAKKEVAVIGKAAGLAGLTEITDEQREKAMSLAAVRIAELISGNADEETATAEASGDEETETTTPNAKKASAA